ncbi:MAG: nadE, partial [Acidimicrobiaceae bacterium]
LVFDGGSMVFDAEGTLVARAAQFVEELLIADIDIEPVYRKRLLDPRGRDTIATMPIVPVSEHPVVHDAAAPVRIADHVSPVAELYGALVLGTRDYVRKNGFTDVVIGLSGGIDSTLVACVAVACRLCGRCCPRCRTRARREHAQSLQQRSLEERRCRSGRRTRHRLPHDPHRAGFRRVPRHDRRGFCRSPR